MTPEIYVSTWSLRDHLRRHAPAPGDWPALAGDHGFAGIEIPDRQLAGCGPGTLEVLGRRLAEADLGVVLDLNTDFCLADPEARQAQLDHAVTGLATAERLGARCARITLGGQGISLQRLLHRRRAARPCGAAGPDRRLTGYLAHRLRRALPAPRPDPVRMARARAALEDLLPHAERRGVALAIENHWGLSSRPEAVMELVYALDSPWLGTCADFGNFPAGVDEAEGLALLLPEALHVQAKALSFNDAGEEPDIPFGRCLGRVAAAGYRGPVGVEYEGPGEGLAGCLATRALLQRHLAAFGDGEAPAPGRATPLVFE